MVRRTAPHPIIFAPADPTPESMPEEARALPDALIATGPPGDPDQVREVPCVPFIFRGTFRGIFHGALDMGATGIDDAMKVTCVEAIAIPARAPVSAEPGAVCQGEQRRSGRTT